MDDPALPASVCLLGMGWFPDQHGGLNRYVRELHDALVDTGQSVRAVVTGPALDPPPTVAVAGRAEQPLLLRMWAFWRSGRAALDASEVHDVHFALYALPLLLTRRRATRPVVVHFHGPWAQESQAMGRGRIDASAKWWVERLVYRRASRFIVLSGVFGELLVRDYKVAPERVRLVRPGVDLERFAVRVGRPELRTRLGLGTGGALILAVRRLVPRMGLDVLLEAWEQLDDPDAQLIVIGSGPLLEPLRAQARQRGLAGVLFAGRVDDDELPLWYAAADVCVVPSLSLEGFGLTVLESLAAGTPVIASDIGGMSEVLPQLSADLLVPAGDPGALTRRLRSAIADVSSPRGALPTREDCRTFAEQHSWAATAEQVRDVYQEARADAVPARIGAGRPPRILFVGHTGQLSGGELALATLLPSLGGVEAHVLLAEDGPLVERLRAQGASVEVLALAERTARLRKGSVRPTAVPAAALIDVGAYVLRLTRRLRQLQPDVVHTNSLKAHLYGGIAARLAGVPQVWHARDHIGTDYLPAAAVRLVRVAARVLPAAVVANSRSTLESLALPSGHRVRRLVLPSPVPPMDLPVDRPTGPTPTLRIGCVGRLAAWKGQDVLVRAVAEAFPDGGAEVRIIGAALFGEQDYETSLRKLVAELGLQDRVILTGFVQDVPAELAQLDVLVHCSRTPEPFGQVVVQGMAAGLAVIAANAGGPAEILDHGKTGLLTPPGDVLALSSALRQLSGDPALRGRLGDAARSAAEQYWPEHVAPRLVELYDQVLNDAGGPITRLRRRLRQRETSWRRRTSLSL